ncbi:inosine-uridine preferring nucleoside hydrolase family protein [Collimonas fungivorans]|uniref:Inosine-uridine preferring nucleoside hydrolase family protein n=1 Tax=Collimonas fungivorans TaxID=158899 RepID=A0A127P5A0_9BURK|nr:nucleoside hydrolase [Collimonas fungivorans]AMO93006.1 inosine-uridine preferring nucleoside hydrolase family protein [Collimonas fungivorans]
MKSNSMRRRLLSTVFMLGLAVAANLPAQAQAAGKRKVIIDDDVGGPRAAQLMAIQSPDVEVLGITIVSGSTWRDENVAHALRTLEVIGRSDIPVVPGSAFPLLNTQEATRRWEALYGKLVYKGAWMDEKWPDGTIQSQPNYHTHDVVPQLAEGMPHTKASNEIAANFMIRKVHEFPGQVTILATGPMTNVALAISLDPSFAETAKEIVYMGGSLNPHQVLPSKSAEQFAREYINTPRLEFNFRWDPEAAKIALRAPWKRIVMVPADPSTATELSARLLSDMTKSNTPLAQMVKKVTETGFPLWDELATAVWLDPTLISKSDQLFVSIDTDFGAGYGNTLSWPAAYAPQGLIASPTTVVREVNVPAFEKLMIRLMNLPTPPAAK